MLKLDCIFNVPNRCIDEVVEELNFISHSASTPIIIDLLQSCLTRHNCEIDEAIVSEMVTCVMLTPSALPWVVMVVSSLPTKEDSILKSTFL